jgi:hypothetical protein
MAHKNNGYKCEQYLARKFRNLGAEVHIRDGHFDLEVKFPNKRVRKIEIKSCKFQTHSGFVRKYGRYDFKYKKNLKKIKKENVWLCFMVYIRTTPEIVGFVNPNKIDEGKRFYTLSEVMALRTMCWKSFVNKLKLEK